MATNGIVTPVFETSPETGRVVEPIDGWVVFHPQDDEEDDPLVREWFKIGELLCAENSRVQVGSA